MALIQCSECKQEISDRAKNCPHCGFQKSKLLPIIGKLVLAVILYLIVVNTYNGYRYYQFKNSANQTFNKHDEQTSARCSVADIEVKITTFSFTNNCRQSECYYMNGAAELVNNCTTETGVQLRIVGLDSNGTPLDTKAFWPESTRNFPVGTTAISLNQALDYDSNIKSITVSPIATKIWPQ